MKPLFLCVIDKQVMNPARARTLVYNIDSRSREIISHTSSDFTYKVVSPLKNIISLKVTSTEIPNMAYNFPAGMTFTLKVNGNSEVLDVPVGNWDTANMETQLNQMFLSVTVGRFVAILDPFMYKLTIKEINGQAFELIFANDDVSVREWYRNFGYLSGFRKKRYEGSSEYMGEAGPDYTGSKYYLMQLNDYSVVTHQTPDGNLVNAMAKIILFSDKNSMVYEYQSFISKEIKFIQPVTLSRFDVKIIDEFGEIVDMAGYDFSFTLEMTQVMSSDVYEKYRRQGIPF